MRFFALTFTILILSPGLNRAADEPRAQHVFIVSIDQGAPAGIEKADMPILDRMAAEGAHTWEAYTVVPSLTLPAHTSMVTGVGVQKHQILWNDYDPTKGSLKVPTIFQIAKEQRKLVTAIFSSKTKLKTLDLPGSLDEYVMPDDVSSVGIAHVFARELPRLKPNLALIHFGEPDAMGHQFGVFSPEKMKALAETDEAIGIMREAVAAAGMADSTIWIITADHGGHDVLLPPKTDTDAQAVQKKYVGTHGTAASEDVLIPWIAFGPHVKKGYTITAPVVQYDTAATALWLLGIPVPEAFWGRPVVSAFD